jgi:16S rRNA (uracil1498-N3)-methyltransferase
MDDIVRKATELGAARIVPLVTERTQVHLASDRSDRKTEKWQTVALEAAKQCGNPWLPDLAAPIALPAFLTAPTSFDLKLVASLEPTARSLKPVLDAFTSAHGRPPASVLWLVGPEGDFSPAEHASLRAAGFEPITLGPLVLRCETAAIAALSILTYELLNR